MKSQDMTKGPIFSQMLYFMIPVFFGNIVQQIYGFADSVIVGMFSGGEALAAIGATDSLTYLVLGCMNGIAGGFAVCTAQTYGSGDTGKLRKFTTLIIRYVLLLAVAAAVITVSLNHILLEKMGTPKEILSQSSTYLSILFLGIPISMSYNASLALLRSVGDSKIGLYLLATSSVTNIILDLLLVGGCHMGVDGAAVATVFAQFISLVIGIIYTYKKYPVLRISRKDLGREKKLERQLFHNGMPMGIQVAITAVATMMIQIALNKEGLACITAFTISTKIQNILTQTFHALGMTMATFVGQNFGSGNLKRIRQGVKTGIVIG